MLWPGEMVSGAQFYSPVPHEVESCKLLMLPDHLWDSNLSLSENMGVGQDPRMKSSSSSHVGGGPEASLGAGEGFGYGV